mmetsp:Transcript_22526/g.30799  ORF Transcript_22526/g.30799 Transcript_22526/m.30799 type:complete len:97 (+) Transcript_22526:1557-1847(+)
MTRKDLSLSQLLLKMAQKTKMNSREMNRASRQSHLFSRSMRIRNITIEARHGFLNFASIISFPCYVIIFTRHHSASSEARKFVEATYHSLNAVATH